MDRRKFLFAALALTLAACSSDTDPQVTSGEEIRLYTQVSGLTRATDNATSLQDAQFAEGTKVSVKVTDNAVSNPVAYPLTQYTVGSAGALALPAGQKQYYPNGSSVNIYAFHPAGAASTFSVKTDQTSADDYKASDLMWASLSNVESTSADHTLAFTHKLAKITVTLVAGDGCSAGDLSSASVSVGCDDLVTSGTFTASSGSFTPAESGTGTILITENAGTTAHAATIVPQAMTGKTINITMGGATRYYIITTASFAPGTKYAYTLRVSLSSIELVSTQITDWDDQSGANSLTPDPLEL